MKSRQSLGNATRGAVVVTVAWGLLSSCALQKSGPQYVKTCVLPSDQTGTLLGHWKVTPVPIAFHQGDFAADEISDIVTAANTWNNFYAASLGMASIDYGGDAANPRMSAAPKPAALCSTGILQGTSYTGAVVIYKDGIWPSGYPSTAIALTSSCPLSATAGTLPFFYMSIMEVNYQGFFVQGRKLPDLQSIFLHEFGHVMGLNHSCESVTKAGTPNCTDPNLNADYYTAVMFPVFGFDASGVGEQKRALQSNDEGRANCLYQSPTGN